MSTFAKKISFLNSPNIKTSHINKNRNEYLLPFFGIKNVQKNDTNTNNKELFDNDINQIIGALKFVDTLNLFMEDKDVNLLKDKITILVIYFLFSTKIIHPWWQFINSDNASSSIQK